MGEIYLIHLVGTNKSTSEDSQRSPKLFFKLLFVRHMSYADYRNAFLNAYFHNLTSCSFQVGGIFRFNPPHFSFFQTGIMSPMTPPVIPNCFHGGSSLAPPRLGRGISKAGFMRPFSILNVCFRVLGFSKRGIFLQSNPINTLDSTGILENQQRDFHWLP